MDIVSIKHGNTEFATITDNSTVTLSCNNKIINDNISASIILEDWGGDYKTSVGDKPTNLTPSATYTGSTITNGYTTPANVTMTGNNSGTETGTYVATYTPNTGYCWSDGTTVSVTVTLTIAVTSNCLCFTANTAGSTVAMSVTGTPTLGQNFQYSIDRINWTTFTPGTTTITLTSVGDKVYFRGDNPNGVSESDSIYYRFVMTGSIASSGNIMSLIDNGACSTLTIPCSSCYSLIFYGCTSLTTAPELPATTLAVSCYTYMFLGCTSLTTAPELPATTLAVSCYTYMFCGCTSLTTAPSLPATTLAERCYYDMFLGCTSLTTAPSLPATTLAERCYREMFNRCTSLTTAPELPATTLAERCYYEMFNNCTSLTTAPTLPATTLAEFCYYGMFYSCTSLTTAPELPATTLAERCYYEMFNGCDSLIVSDTSGTGYNKAWRIPKSGTFTNTYVQENMFSNCATGSGRSSDAMAGEAGKSYTYYTQNTPV